MHTHVREDALQLFGFATVDERSAFELLIGISGVGPRLALAILSLEGANFLLLDEPTASVDTSIGCSVYELLEGLSAAMKERARIAPMPTSWPMAMAICCRANVVWETAVS